MSVFGGDSWGREAQYRKRRVDDLLLQPLHASSSYKKLPTGKFACLLCPNNPILDSPLMLSVRIRYHHSRTLFPEFSLSCLGSGQLDVPISMHNKGSRHLAAESRLKERELMKQNEINKRIALSDSSTDTPNSSRSYQKVRSTGKPLIEQTQKAVSEILPGKSQQQMENRRKKEQPITGHIVSATCDSTERYSAPAPAPSPASVEADRKVSQQPLDFRERRERELKFTAAGWKRDGHGKWYQDENVEFDSDEEDPNVVLIDNLYSGQQSS
ncbi:sodium channel modifier 1-like [Senna tora]|uniref:Sodium channel modifier 1-like n=1 Tax=Senna tora TaxID=362788 RepID=A0A835CFI1_9FABA|nr:sodium channel modifier 1-like [Senna tora]